MGSIKTLLTQRIAEADPTIDILGSDRKILQVAQQDLANYLRFFWNLGPDARDNDISEMMEQFSRDEPAEFESFLAIWIGLWLKKWKTRVKLLLGVQNPTDTIQNSTALVNAQPLWEKITCRKELKEIVVSSLIRNAEICGTEILAETLLKRELAKLNRQTLDDKQLLVILNNSMHNAREMAQKIGPLIFVKIDQTYFAP